MSSTLVISGDATLRGLLRSLLEKDGHEVTEASDGEMGIRTFRETPTDLVIIEIELPKKSGLAVIQELSYEFPSTNIIALTDAPGKMGKVAQIYAEVFGALYVFVKPVCPNEFEHIVQTLLHTNAK